MSTKAGTTVVEYANDGLFVVVVELALDGVVIRTISIFFRTIRGNLFVIWLIATMFSSLLHAALFYKFSFLFLLFASLGCIVSCFVNAHMLMLISLHSSVGWK